MVGLTVFVSVTRDFSTENCLRMKMHLDYTWIYYVILFERLSHFQKTQGEKGTTFLFSSHCLDKSSSGDRNYNSEWKINVSIK